jgi:[protein-PII] uridylyltransferase
MATGPAAWSDWTANLLRELFLKTLNVIENGELASAAAIAIVDRKREQVTRLAKEGTPGVDCERLLEAMSPRYLLLTPASDIFEHVALFESLSAPAEFVWNVAPSANGSTRTVTICAVDRPGLISKMAGVFTLNSINILDVQVFTWKNQVALDIFTVTPPPDAIFEKEKWQKTRAQLSAALAGELELGAALEKRLSVKKQTGPKGLIRPHSVKVDNNTSSFFTIVEVYTYDFPGLLYAVTDALFRCGLDIWVAKIATKVDQVVDVFYVRDENGQKVDAPEEVRRIENAILERLPDLARTA